MKIGVLGAGAIGCWLGGKLEAAGHDVVLVGRDWLREAVAKDGLSLEDLDGPPVVVRPRVETSPSVLGTCDAVLVAVKGKDTVAAAEQARVHLSAGAVVMSCQNGLDNAARLRETLPKQRVLAGMVSFNVVRQGPSSFKRGTSGPLAIEACPESVPLAAALRDAGFDTLERPDMDNVLSAKLVFNLNNAINALSDMPLQEELLEPEYRRQLADAMDEAKAVLAAAGRPAVRVGKLLPGLAPMVLRLPTPLFRLVARQMLRVDPQARSSMWEDLSRGRTTEIDDLNGTVSRLGRVHGIVTPVNDDLVERIRQAEAANEAERSADSA
ncbi:MAG: 2-dehydropantoate 2-reductase [Proteobacteria bacterium]|nr:2-dehydropantoate 2-reductase [Pseudomonadota bacterium]